MIKMNKPISILEIGSTHLKLLVNDEKVSNKSLFYEEKIKHTKGEKKINENSISKTIIRAEKDLGYHLNEIILMIDAVSINSLYISIKKNFDNKHVNYIDIDHLISEVEQIIIINNIDKEILHTVV